MKQAKSKKRRVFEGMQNGKTIHDHFTKKDKKMEKKANVYLEKIAKDSGSKPSSTKTIAKGVGIGAGVGATYEVLKHATPLLMAHSVGKGDNFAKVIAGVLAAKGATKGALLGGAIGTGLAVKNKLQKKASEKWIQGAIKHPGALHKELGISEDKKIPKATLDAAAKRGGKLGERARLAETLEGMHKKAEIKIMENKYLEKLAGDKLRGYIAPNWMEHSIAKKKEGKEGPKGFVANAKSYLKGSVRTVGRGLGEGILGGAAGAALGVGAAKLLKVNPDVAGFIAGQTGYTGGALHGAVSSLKNQEKEMHAKYKNSNNHEKKAGLLTSALGAVKTFAKGAVADAPKLGGQLKNVKTAYNANGGLFNKGTMSTIKAVAGNKAVQAGAGLVGTGVVAGRMSKQAQENKYLAKLVR